MSEEWKSGGKKCVKRGKNKKKGEKKFSQKEKREEHSMHGPHYEISWQTSLQPWQGQISIYHLNGLRQLLCIKTQFYLIFFSWILATQHVSGRDTESGWMKEDDSEVGLGSAAERWEWKWKKGRKRKMWTRKKMKPKWTNSAGGATQRIHLRVVSCPVCVSMETALLSVCFCTDWR